MWSISAVTALGILCGILSDDPEAPDVLSTPQNTTVDSPQETKKKEVSPQIEALSPETQHTSEPAEPEVVIERTPISQLRLFLDAAKMNDEKRFESYLSRSFREAAAYLQEHDEPGSNRYGTHVFMDAVSTIAVSKIEETILYDRATVRVEAEDERVFLFSMRQIDEDWFVLPPAPMRARVAELQRPVDLQAMIEQELSEDIDTKPLSGTGVAQPVADSAASRPNTTDPAGPPSMEPTPLEPQAEAPASQPASSEKPETVGFFQRGSIGHYLWYVPDWLLLGGMATAFALKLDESIPPLFVAIGPDYDPENPDGSVLRDPRLDNIIGRPYVQEKIPSAAIVAAGLVGTGLAAGIDAVRHREFHHTHALVLGGLTSGLLALSTTQLIKQTVGRLRPDFRDRYTRAACGGYVNADSSLDCSTAPQDGFVMSQNDVYDGMKSFPSAHASTSFSLATYYSLYLGTEWVFGAQAPSWSMPIATLGMGGLYAAALFVAASRFSDNRHHLEDIVVGAALGTTVGTGTYFMHFDLNGQARTRGFQLSPLKTEGEGGGLVLSGTF